MGVCPYSSGRMAIILATFVLAFQEILNLLYFALLFINDQTELISLVAKNACCTPQGTSHMQLIMPETNNKQRALLFLKIIEFAKVWLMRNK